MRNRVLIAVLLTIATVAGYSSVVSCGFISFDDPGYVYSNRYVRQGISWDSWCYAWRTFDCGNWHPVTWLSLELDTSLWGVNPKGYHVTSLLLHITNVVLLFLALHRMTAQIGSSAVVAALFALHPLHVESVAWISERKDVLSSFFLLVTLMAYVHYAARRNWGRYLLVVLLFVLGLLAKPMLVTLPILLLFIDGWPLDRIDWQKSRVGDARFPRESLPMLLFEKIPLFAIAFCDGLITIVAQRNSMNILNDVPLGIRIGNMFNAYFWYLFKTFCPTNLTIYYPHPENDLSWGQISCGIISIFTISAYVVWQGRARPYLIVGWIWFVVSLLPVIGLLQVGGQAYADRYVYIPHIGLFILVVWEAQYLMSATTFGNWAYRSVVTIVLLTCGILTRTQVSYWTSNETLWTHTIEILPDNYIGYLHLADLRWSQSDYEGTIDNLTKTLQKKRGLQNFNPDAYCMLGKSLIALNRSDEAERYFLAALKDDEYHEKSLDELSKLLRMQNRLNDLEEVSVQHVKALMQAIEKHPNDPEKRFSLGVLLAQQGKFSSAITQFQKATEFASQSATAYNNLAMAQANLSRFQEAKSNFLRAIELDSTLANAHFYLAEIFEMEQDLSSAKGHYAEAIRLNPDDKDAKERLNQITNP